MDLKFPELWWQSEIKFCSDQTHAREGHSAAQNRQSKHTQQNQHILQASHVLQAPQMKLSACSNHALPALYLERPWGSR